MTSYLGVIRTVMLADTSQFNLAIRGASKEMRTSAMQMRTSAQSLVGIGAALNLGITIPTLLAIRAISKVGIEFDTNMMKIRNVTDMTSDTLTKFRDAQKGISSTVAMSQLDLSKIAYIGGQAQLKTVAQLTNFQKAIANAQLAYPSDAPIEAVASGFTSVINSFGIQASDYEKTMAEMIQTINLGTISWEEYANTIKQVVAVSSSLQDPDAFQKLNVAMAMATQGGVSGKSVATAIRNIYTRIWKESSQSKSGLNFVAKQQGYKSAADMFESGAGKDLITYIKMVTNDGKNATPEIATSLGMMQREITSFLKLANANPAQLAQFREQMATAHPDFIKKVQEAQSNPQTITARLSAAFSNLKLSFWEVIGPKLLQFVEALTRLIDTIGRLPEATKKLLFAATMMLSVGSAFLLLVGIVKSAIFTLSLLNAGGIGSAVRGVPSKKKLAAMTTAQLLQVAAAQTGVYGVGVPNPAKMQGRGPNGRFLSYAQTAGNAKNLSSMGGAGVGSFFANLGKSVKGFLASLGRVSIVFIKFAGIAALVYTVFKGLWDALSVTLVPALAGFGIDLKDLGGIFQWVTSLLSILSKVVAGAFIIIISTVETIFGVLIELFKAIWQGLKWVGKKAWSWVTGEEPASEQKPFTYPDLPAKGADESQRQYEERAIKWDEKKAKSRAEWNRAEQARLEDTAFAGIGKELKYLFAGGVFEKKIQALLDKYIKVPPDQPPPAPTAPETFTVPLTTTPGALNELLMGARGQNAAFAEYGTQAGFNATLDAQNTVTDAIERLRRESERQNKELATLLQKGNDEQKTTNDVLKANVTE
jgi:TP901 family phage tail tape measure protein